ncbi:MAG TPA: shikimate dehydrogenase [Dissulfurispiraceae bacterium]|nr:shikimate dehydrogenase [Dissulfurispiraceae bacterium]
MAAEEQVSNISGKTRIVALLGHPVGHTLSPRMQNAAFRSVGLDCCYVAFDVQPSSLPDAVLGMRALGLLGANVTIPHKESVSALLDEVDSEAVFIGAVNTIVNRNGRLCGYNTDGLGFMRSLVDENIAAAGKQVLILGAGGAARAVAYYLAQEAAELVLANRTPEKAERLAADLTGLGAGVRGVSMEDIQHAAFLDDMDIIIHATSSGLNPSDPPLIDSSLFNERQVVCDLIYRDTPLVLGARQAGARTLTGLGMLLWQGVLAFELWTTLAAPVDIMRHALMESRQNSAEGSKRGNQ